MRSPQILLQRRGLGRFLEIPFNEKYIDDISRFIGNKDSTNGFASLTCTAYLCGLPLYDCPSYPGILNQPFRETVLAMPGGKFT